jgi:hypothetical protein
MDRFTNSFVNWAISAQWGKKVDFIRESDLQNDLSFEESVLFSIWREYFF